jgi:hypothetical protein
MARKWKAHTLWQALWVVVVLAVPAVVPADAVSAAKSDELSVPAEARKVFEGEYIHRVAGRDSQRAKMVKYVGPDKTMYFDLTQADVHYLLTMDGQGRPVSYRLRSAARDYTVSWRFAGEKVVRSMQSANQGAEKAEWNVKAGALPDLNSRPDPYLIQYVLLAAYKLDKRGEQTFVVYDVDNTGKGINHYEITLTLVDEDGVLLGGSKRPARHFLQVQRTASNTWFKKQPGHKTEYWVDDNGILLRVYRHREPYEVILQVPEAAKPAEAGAYGSDLEAFLDEMDRTYPFFEVKGIRPDWDRTKVRLREKVKTCPSDEQFLGIVQEAILCLHDSHMGFAKTRVSPPPWPAKYCLGVSFLPATNGRVVVMSCRDGLDPALKTGVVVTKIDDQNARSYLEERTNEVWAQGGMSSRQRARLLAYRLPLQTEQKGQKHTLSVLANASEHRVELACDFDARSGFPHWYHHPEGLKQVGSCAYTRLPSGVGYIYLRRIDTSTAPGLKEAFSTYADVKGWIVDLRGNGGGGYDQALLDLLKSLPQPSAGIIDAGCISAGETFARDLVQYAQARLFGATTAGASTSKRDWTFPSGIATLSLSVRSRWGLDGQTIECNGIQPHVEVEAIPEDLLQGRNTEIVKAEQYLLAASGGTKVTSP